MRRIAVISHPLRINECEIFLRLVENQDLRMVLCPESIDFSNMDFPQGCEAIFYKKGASSILQRSAFPLFVNKVKISLRSGSNLGLHLEHLIQKTRERLAPYRRWSKIKKRGEVSDSLISLNKQLLYALNSIHELESISAIVAFDAFDLPTLLDFADSKGIGVHLR
tara:strand:+ start:431 stop:928 length:498 start_codon:yes stop_codon:yes gene_type:complete